MKPALPAANDAQLAEEAAAAAIKAAATIKYALELQQYTQADVARECKVSRNTVHMVIRGKGRSRKIELRIAAITRLPLAELWPQWYGDKSIRRQRRPYSTARTTSAPCAAVG